jgi:hypothetical protein
MSLQRFVIERDLPGVGSMSENELSSASSTSNDAIKEIFPKVQWEHSYVAAGKTFCIYLAENEEAIQRHAELSGFPATVVTPISRMIDPTTARD